MHYKLKNVLLQTDMENLKDFRNNHDFRIVEVEDQGILSDIDTISDLDKITGKE